MCLENFQHDLHHKLTIECLKYEINQAGHVTIDYYVCPIRVIVILLHVKVVKICATMVISLCFGTNWVEPIRLPVSFGSGSNW